MAVMMYAQDYDETYPPLWYNPTGHWPNIIRAYFSYAASTSDGSKGRGGIMVCPSAVFQHPGWAYAMSQEFSIYDAKLGGYRGMSIASTSTPARVLMIAEAPQVKDWKQASIQIETTDPKCWGGPLGNGVDVQGYLDTDGISASTLGNCATALPRYRHNGGALIAWGDGHASWRRKGSLRWCRDVSAKEPGADCPP
jgi:prepilin-type processing-associated H-X9-DG protein